MGDVGLRVIAPTHPDLYSEVLPGLFTILFGDTDLESHHHPRPKDGVWRIERPKGLAKERWTEERRFHAFLDVANDPQRSWDALREKRGAAATETLRRSVDAARRRVPGADARLLDGPPTVERMSLEGTDWPRGRHGRSWW